MIPRLTLATVERLRDEMVLATLGCRRHKLSVLWRALLLSPFFGGGAGGADAGAGGHGGDEGGLLLPPGVCSASVSAAPASFSPAVFSPQASSSSASHPSKRPSASNNPPPLVVAGHDLLTDERWRAFELYRAEAAAARAKDPLRVRVARRFLLPGRVLWLERQKLRAAPSLPRAGVVASVRWLLSGGGKREEQEEAAAAAAAAAMAASGAVGRVLRERLVPHWAEGADVVAGGLIVGRRMFADHVPTAQYEGLKSTVRRLRARERRRKEAAEAAEAAAAALALASGASGCLPEEEEEEMV
jgi:hypothetical protein